MERQIDFFRERHMLCGACDHGWVVDLNWVDRPISDFRQRLTLMSM